MRTNRKSKIQMIFVSFIVMLFASLIFSGSVQALINDEFDTLLQQPAEFYVPIYSMGDDPIYCVQYGNAERFKDGKISWEEALRVLDNPKAFGKKGEHGEHKTQTKYENQFTDPHYIPGNSGTLSPAMAYIISEKPFDAWSEEKQIAIWNLLGSGLDGGLVHGGVNTLFGESEYDQPARDYAVHDDLVRPNGMQPNDLTDMDDVYVHVNQNTNEYIVGPFTLDYISGIYGNIAFGGISDMHVIGYDASGSEVDDNIAINRIILDGNNSVTPEYFEPDELKVDRTNQVYPEPGQEFYIVFKDPNRSGNRVSKISISVEFQYMLANGEYVELDGYKIVFGADDQKEPKTCNEPIDWNDEGKVTKRCKDKIYTAYPTPELIELQDSISAEADREIHTEELEIAVDLIDITMDLGGHVWEDKPGTKESVVDGLRNISGGIDIPLENVKVTLYESNGRLAELDSDTDELMHTLNPTLTDDEGNYMFNGLDAMKKYYVTFEYNGQIYMPTEYLNTENGQFNSVDQMVNAGLYDPNGSKDTSIWRVTSKGTEPETSGDVFDDLPISRDDYDTRFQEIGSYPGNYRSTNSLGHCDNYNGEYYNAVYTQKDLMGYVMDENGKYHQTGIQLVDGFAYDENGLQTDVYLEGEISTRIRNYINRHGRYPTNMRSIYEAIAGNDTEIWRMLQFIEDCYIEAYTGSPFTQDVDLYPVYDCFTINGDEDRGYPNISKTIDGVRYRPIYEGQFYVNLGLYRRQEYDSSLRKDVYKAALKINDKTVIYNYDKRNTNMTDGDGLNSGTGQDNNTYWDINLRVSDYDTYYNTKYNRELYPTDYNYNVPDGIGVGHPGDSLEVYITYKITIRNQSMSIMSQIKEVVDYYDQDYTFKPNLSWVMYSSGTTAEERKTNVTEEEYYNMMKVSQDEIDDDNLDLWKDTIANSKDALATQDSIYVSGATQGLGGGYQKIYVHGLESKKLATGESAYIYLTFEVKKDAQERVLLDEESSPKENIAEINGYTTFYRDGTELPNGVSKGQNDIAGLLDRDSNPGNLVSSDVFASDGSLLDKYEKNFEDDTDRAPSIRIILDNDAMREINGTVWEDERNETVGNPSGDAIIGDGIRQDGEEAEIGISGVTVELVEKRPDNSEYIWYTTTTDENGRYRFDNTDENSDETLRANYRGFIPGDYVIRFKYGNTEATTLMSADGNDVSYNGQDFKSGYIYYNSQNVPATYNEAEWSNNEGTFGYDIYRADAENAEGRYYSDAKDLWNTDDWEDNIASQVYILQTSDSGSGFNLNEGYDIQGREDVINYSNNNVTNHVAEVLASPYERPSYNGTEYTDSEMAALYQELMNRTYMTAETGIIAIEFEYDRQETDGYNTELNNAENSSKNYIGDNQYNGNYTLNNIDLGLTERPKAQLEIDKSISNVKVTLANNNILFDIVEETNNAIWQDHKEYNIDRYKVDASEDEKRVDSDSGDNYYQEGDAIGMYDEFYGNGHRYSFRTSNQGVNGNSVDNIVSTTDKGLIQLTMDEELMHGATIQITYKIKVTNVGEVDYVDGEYKNFYYRGNTEGAHISKTTAEQVIDYVQNNLQFEAVNEVNSTDGWSVITAESLMGEDLVNDKLSENLAQFNTIIQTENLGNDNAGLDLEPGDEITKTLILSQLITPENTNDDLTYTNMVEIVKTSNENGRRMAYSVVGNQNPLLDDASELDSSTAERIVILPPFGETRMYYILGITVAVILIAGVVLIKKKVLKKTK